MADIAAAAGFTVKNEKLPELKAQLLAIAERELGKIDLTPTLVIDARLNLRGFNRRRVEDAISARAVGRPVDETDVGLQIMDGLDRLRPFGYHNATPVFVSCGLEVKGRAAGWRRRASPEAGAARRSSDVGCHCLSPGRVARPSAGARADVAYTLEVNEWNGRRQLQLNVKDIKSAEEAE